jgi:Peptidase family M23
VTSLRRGRGVAKLFLMVSLVAAAPAGAASTTALKVEAVHAPEWVHGTDGRKHVEYDLAVTNAFSADATLESLEVRGGGRRLLRLQGAALAAVTRPLFAEEPTARISAASTNVILMDLVLPRSFGRAAPRRLTHRIRYSIPADARARSIIGNTTVDAPVLRVDRRRPVVIGAPLRGSGWLDSNGCCDDPTANHRFTILAFDGALVNAEVFAIDWTRLVGGALYTGDGRLNSDWAGFGAPIYSVAGGTVVSTIDDLPDIPPFEANPGLRRPADWAGNNAIVRIGPGRYAVYGHLQAGSVRVRRGQRVRAGQQLGRLGNSGNTQGPHLHFGIQERPNFFSRSVPFVIDRFRLEGVGERAPTPPRVRVTGPPRMERRSFPLIRSVATFTPRTPRTTRP